MREQWKELKETITELRDNNGTGTQQEVCKFLANLMEVLEKQMSGSENSLHKVKDTLKGVIDAMTIYSQWDEGYVAGIESAVDTINRYLGEEE